MPDFEAEKKHVDDLWSKVPEEFQSFTFDDLIRNRIELEYFRKFLEQNYVKLVFNFDISMLPVFFFFFLEKTEIVMFPLDVYCRNDFSFCCYFFNTSYFM